MKLIFAAPELDPSSWLPAIQAAIPDAELQVYGSEPEDYNADYALVWLPPAGFFGSQPQLKAIINLGAGVDKLLAQPDFPDDVPLLKLRDAGMGPVILDYVRYGLLHFGRGFDRYRADQTQRQWQPLEWPNPYERKIVVLGTGAIGQTVAKGLVSDGYAVRSWGRSEKQVDGVEVFVGPERLQPCLNDADVLINLLPCTPLTRGLIGAEQLGWLNEGATVISAGRGEVIQECAMVDALQSGQLRGALLDVFEQEPLPENSLLWQLDQVIITPHIAGPTLIDGAICQIREYIGSIENGNAVHLVSKTAGY